jgi:hypothetical protein
MSISRNLLLYWKPETADYNMGLNDEGLEHAASNQLGRAKRGDTLWIVTVRDGRLFLINRFRIDLSTDQHRAARRLNKPASSLWDAKFHVLTDDPEPLQNLDINDIAASLRFEGVNDRLRLRDGLVNPQQLQTMRYLTTDSAHLLAERWGVDLLDDSAPLDGTTGQGYLADSKSRRVVELCAMEAAIAHYSAQGYAVEDTSNGRPYDLRCCKGSEEVRVEVKGSQTEGGEVILTAGEVEHARGCRVRMDLFIWGYVEVVDNGEAYQGIGGRLVAHLTHWKPDDADLAATEYCYRVPR